MGIHLVCADLLLPAVPDDLLNSVRSHRVTSIHAGIECSSFSVLRIRVRCSSRSRANPWGDESFTGEREGNTLARNIIVLLHECEQNNIWFTFGNLHSSRRFDFPPLRKLEKV